MTSPNSKKRRVKTATIRVKKPMIPTQSLNTSFQNSSKQKSSKISAGDRKPGRVLGLRDQKPLHLSKRLLALSQPHKPRFHCELCAQGSHGLHHRKAGHSPEQSQQYSHYQRWVKHYKKERKKSASPNSSKKGSSKKRLVKFAMSPKSFVKVEPGEGLTRAPPQQISKNAVLKGKAPPKNSDLSVFSKKYQDQKENETVKQDDDVEIILEIKPENATKLTSKLGSTAAINKEVELEALPNPFNTDRVVNCSPLRKNKSQGIKIKESKTVMQKYSEERKENQADSQKEDHYTSNTLLMHPSKKIFECSTPTHESY